MFYPEESLLRSMSAEESRERFKNYCDWCWGHGYGDCDICKKNFENYMKEDNL
jgi:hypothetical protein